MKKTIKLMNEFSKFAWYKINIQKSVAFLYTDNELSEMEIKKKKSHLNCIKNKEILNIFIQGAQKLTL